MNIAVGSRWRSAVCDTEVVVVRAPADRRLELQCGGHLMVPKGTDPPEGAVLAPAMADGSLLGKRYTDSDGALEILVTKAGHGMLAADGKRLQVKEAKPLPSSD